MTSLNFKQDTSRSDPDNPWLGMRMYQLTPWPEEVEITYYDFGPGPEIKKGQTTRFDWENGSAEYQAMEDGLDVTCRLLPGSTWTAPPKHLLEQG